MENANTHAARGVVAEGEGLEPPGALTPEA